MVQGESLRQACLDRFVYVDGDLVYSKGISSNAVKGQVAGWIAKNGYRQVAVFDKKYYVHRLIFLMKYGFLPNLIDHINQNKLDNRIENLREATKSQNSFNTGKPITNTSGYKNICLRKKPPLYAIQFTVKGKKVARYSNCLQEAISIREVMRNELNL